MEREEWRVIQEFPDYAVSDLGQVKRIVFSKYSMSNGKTISQSLTYKGYLTVYLFKNGGKKHLHVHSLVARAFIGLCPPGLQVNHKDAIKTNNGSSNLEYITNQENITHAVNHGLFVKLSKNLAPWIKKGQDHRFAKLRDIDISRILEFRNLGLTCKEISNKFGVCRSTIQCILAGRTWKHLCPTSHTVRPTQTWLRPGAIPSGNGTEAI